LRQRKSEQPARDALAGLLVRCGVAELSRRLLTRGGRFALVFHGISAKKQPSIPLGVQPYLSAADLHSVLAWLDTRFGFLTPEEFLDGAAGGVLLTFDDGFANNYFNALPVLEIFQAPAVFFVTTQHVKNPQDWLPFVSRLCSQHNLNIEELEPSLAREYFNGMSREQVKACADHPLITVGAHTTSHPMLTTCSQKQLISELVDSRQYLEEITGQKIDLFAYPSGDYNGEVLSSVRKTGYRAAFVEYSQKIGDPLFEIPRVGVYNSNPGYLAVKLSGLHKPAPSKIPGGREAAS